MKTVCRARAKPLAIAVLALFLAVPAAAQVTFSTTGSFGGAGGCSGLVCTIGGITLTFQGINSSSVNPNPATFTSFGSFFVSDPATLNNTAPASFTGVTFTLTINQTVPMGGSDQLGPGTITGTLSYNNSTAIFTPLVGDVVNIGSTTYTFMQPFYVLVPETTNNGETTLQGQITSQSPVPEPATMFLLGTGLLGLAGARRRRKQQA